MRTHTKDKPFSCEECGKEFVLKGDLAKHMKKYIHNKDRTCRECSKLFESKASLIRHRLLHTEYRKTNAEGMVDQKEGTKTNEKKENEKYISGEYNEELSCKRTLDYYANLHSKKQSQCNECKEAFGFKTHLAAHRKIHSKKEIFTCEQCGKKLCDETKLISHSYFHTERKPLLIYISKSNFNAMNAKKHLVLKLILLRTVRFILKRKFLFVNNALKSSVMRQS